MFPVLQFIKLLLAILLFTEPSLGAGAIGNIACPHACICLSQTEVLCNTGGLQEIPTKRLPLTVENLSLAKNNFPIIRSDAFAGLRYLRKLSLDGNNITTIKAFAFRGLHKIREISIQHTPLATVAPFSFAGLQNLTAIILSHNKIVRIEHNAFAGTSNVQLLLLSHNPMLKLESNAFSGLTHVEHLLLPTGLRCIEPDAFAGMETVGLLKLAFMDLDELSPFTFQGLTNVAVLSLQESDLGVVCANAFDGLSHVGTMQLLNNKIDVIEALNFTHSHHIRNLVFQGNHLLETPDPNAILLEGIRNLSVTDNFFPCGCHVHTLLDSALANGSYQRGDFLSRNFCISPLDMNGRAMSELDLYAIGRCQDEVMRENLDAKSGAEATRGFVVASRWSWPARAMWMAAGGLMAVGIDWMNMDKRTSNYRCPYVAVIHGQSVGFLLPYQRTSNFEDGLHMFLFDLQLSNQNSQTLDKDATVDGFVVGHGQRGIQQRNDLHQSGTANRRH